MTKDVTQSRHVPNFLVPGPGSQNLKRGMSRLNGRKACLARVVGETYQAGIPRESIDHLVHFMKADGDELWVAESA
jgi:hypothetical protein